MRDDQIRWGRTIGPAAPHWPDTCPAQPEAAHAASEVNDDDDERGGHVLVTALVACGLTLGALVIAWGLWSA